nr:hypothetical protein [uncultured Methanoregula sp.]
MTHFRERPGSKSASRRLKHPFPDSAAFSAVVQVLQLNNPLGCTSYYAQKRNFPPVMPVRERYTAKFVYLDATGKQVGSSSEVYDSAEGYETGIASMITNMANIASHRGRVKHIRDADLFSVTLKCHDPSGELYYVSLARNRITVSSYADDTIRRKVEAWADSVPELN